MKKTIEAAADQAASKAVEHALEAFTEVVDETVGAAERRLGAMIEDVRSQVSVIAEGFQGNAEKLDNHEKRIERLEDRSGLPVPSVD